MKKGFTLVELLGTIIILGLLTFVVAVPIVARINKNAEKINDATVKMLRESVVQYIDIACLQRFVQNGLKSGEIIDEPVRVGIKHDVVFKQDADHAADLVEFILTHHPVSQGFQHP